MRQNETKASSYLQLVESSSTFSWVFSGNGTGGQRIGAIHLVGVAVDAARIK